MRRKIVEIDEKRCNGCGACAAACHEGAIAMVDGKARLIRDDYCDGLGDCLPACPVDAIRIIEREAAAYDEAAVKARQSARTLPCGCPGTQVKKMERKAKTGAKPSAAEQSQLTTWPVQIQLVPAHAPYLDGAKLLVAADCTAYAYAGFHQHFLRGHVALVGCPKLDNADYAEKIGEILRANRIESLTVVRMEVPCCGGLEQAVQKALQNSGKQIPFQVITLSTDGRILNCDL